MIKKIKNTILIVILCSCFLSGCSLFPLQEGQDTGDSQTDVVTSETAVITPEPSETAAPTETIAPTETTEPELNYRSEDVIAPVKIPETEAEEDDVMYCISPVNIRAAASPNASILGELMAGEKVTVYGTTDGWVEVRYQGQTAYIYGEYLSYSQN